MNNSDECLKIKSELLDRGASLVGFADLSEIPSDARDSQRFAVSIAVALDPAVIAGISEGPTQKYRLEYKRANALLSKLADCAAGMLNEWGHKAIPKAPQMWELIFKPRARFFRTKLLPPGLGWDG